MSVFVQQNIFKIKHFIKNFRLATSLEDGHGLTAVGPHFCMITNCSG